MADVNDEREARAWAVYLKETRNLIEWQYAECEPYCWQSLQEKLRKLDDRRKLARACE